MQEEPRNRGLLHEKMKRTARQSTLRIQHGDLFGNLSGGLLEIGCGHGHWLTTYAEQHPDEYCVGVDLISHRIKKSQKKVDKRMLNNIRFIKAEAVEWIEILPDDVALSKIMILFPDPWPKKRHHRRRLIQADFLTLAATKMAQGGNIYFRTDHEDYFKWARAQITAHPDWELDAFTTWPMEQSTYFQDLVTNYHSLTATVVKK
jgi:tRNA (guanine-N7-)-methyltransferase